MSNLNDGTIHEFSSTGADLGVFASGLSGPALITFTPAAPATVPKPSSLALLSLGGLGLAGWRRWKKWTTE